MKNYLNKKGISDAVIKKFNINWNDSTIFFPVVDKLGITLYTKYRRVVGCEVSHMMNPKGSHIAMYGANALHTSNSNNVVIAEGESDCLALHSIGVTAVTSTTGAMSFKEEWITDDLTNKNIYVCFDNDIAGHKGMLRLWQLYPKAKFCFLTEENDVSDFITKHSKEEMIALLKNGTRIEEGFKSHLGIKFTKEQESYPQFIHRPVSGQWTDNDEQWKQIAKDVDIRTLLKFNRQNRAVCPFHGDHEPSLAVIPNTNTAKCFACGQFADTIEITKKVHGKTYYEAIEYLAGQRPKQYGNYKVK